MRKPREFRPKSTEPSEELKKLFNEKIKEAELEIIRKVEESVERKMEESFRTHKDGPYKSVFYGIVAALIASFLWTMAMNQVDAMNAKPRSTPTPIHKEYKSHVEKAIGR